MELTDLQTNYSGMSAVGGQEPVLRSIRQVTLFSSAWVNGRWGRETSPGYLPPSRCPVKTFALSASLLWLAYLPSLGGFSELRADLPFPLKWKLVQATDSSSVKSASPGFQSQPALICFGARGDLLDPPKSWFPTCEIRTVIPT